MEVFTGVVTTILGVALVLVVLDAAVRTFVLPRGAVVRMTRVVSISVRRLFDLRMRFARTYDARDRIMALYAPMALFTLVAVWLVMVLAGFTLIFFGVEGNGWKDAFITSGSCLFTLGFERPAGLTSTAIGFADAAIGLGLLALLIAYLPTIYGSFSRREVLVAQMAALAGTPPSPVDLLVRSHRINRLDDLDDLWNSWQLWFAEVEETHTSLAFLNFFRSPDPHRHWTTASACTLDSAALILSTVDVPFQPMAGLCIRSGFTSLRAVATFFQMPYDPDPAPDDPISITRDEWEGACRELEAAGLPLKPDRDRAWRDFAGWRVNYDVPLVTLAGFLVAPYARWSSDRSVPFRLRMPGRRPAR